MALSEPGPARPPGALARRPALARAGRSGQAFDLPPRPRPARPAPRRPMTVYLVRHARAGDRHDWGGADDLRPLSKPGRRQAEALVDALRDARVDRILS